MKPDSIHQLVLVLPPRDPYFQSVVRHESGQWPLTLPERLQIALRDPALPWNVTAAYARAELPLPDFDWSPEVRRAYQSLLHPERRDENLRSALELRRPERWFERDVIRALLWCPDSNDATIAGVFQINPEVVHLIEALFWLCRDRFGDQLYKAQLLHGGRSELRRDEFGRNLLRLAFKTGKCHAVLHAARLSRPSEQGELDAIAGQLEAILCTLAATGQAEALALVDKFLEEPAAAEEIDVLTRISQDPRAQAAIKKILWQGAAERLQALRAELARKSAAVVDPSGSGNSGSTPSSPDTP